MVEIMETEQIEIIGVDPELLVREQRLIQCKPVDDSADVQLRAEAARVAWAETNGIQPLGSTALK